VKITSTLAVLTATSILAGCSFVNQSMKSITKLGSQGEDSYKASSYSSLAVPPALALPSGVASANSNLAANSNRSRQTNRSTATLSGDKNYYVVVGTYPDSEKAIDTFVRLSSIGLPNATMESRVTKTGKSLHMVRLGPFKRQSQIDKVKDNLMSDGLTQFKVVES